MLYLVCMFWNKGIVDLCLQEMNLKASDICKIAKNNFLKQVYSTFSLISGSLLVQAVTLVGA